VTRPGIGWLFKHVHLRPLTFLVRAFAYMGILVQSHSESKSQKGTQTKWLFDLLTLQV